MEFTREIYWNVGHGLTTLVPMYLLTFAAVAMRSLPQQVREYCAS